MKKLKGIFYCFGVFMAGHVVALNLATMFPSETYKASWSTIAIASAFGLFFAFGAIGKGE